ncbi:MAG: hypothetical protein K2H97_09440, partial [Prevotella sp.]|nr:hypothetical protein [Prevotella sp.]
QRHRLKPPNQPFEASKHPEFSIDTQLLPRHHCNPDCTKIDERCSPMFANVRQCPPMSANNCQ